MARFAAAVGSIYDSGTSRVSIQFVAAGSTHVALEGEHVHALRSRERGCFLVVQTLNTFGRNEIEVVPISSALLRIACLVILYKTCRVPDQELAADGYRTGMRTRARLLKQNENRRDGAATGPWSYPVVRSCGSGRARPPRSRRARCAEDAGCRQRRDRFRSCPVSRPRPCHGLSRRRIGPMLRHPSPCQGLWHCQNEDEPGVLNRRCLHQRT
jgi:hypothetical protein